MKTIELNDQQVDYLKEMLEEIANDSFRIVFGDQKYSRTYQAIAQQIINKLEE